MVDINVILDVAGERQPHRDASQKILTAVERKRVHGFVSAASYPILYYLLEREIGPGDAREYLTILSELFSVVPLDKPLLDRALKIRTEDYEDAIQIASAEACRADHIVTRDARGFKNSSVPALTPSEYLGTFF